MLERLVENWLTSVGELGYQTPFAELLVSEGHRMLQGPVHHPFEHGKDILTINAEGELCAYQLKGPREISDLKGLEKYQGQLDALAMAAISHPAIGGSRLADRVFVVTNGVLRPEVRDRLNQISIGNTARRLPPLEYIERDQLVARLLAAHGKYLPSDPPSFLRLVELYSQTGAEPLPLDDFLAFLESILPDAERTSRVEAARALTSMALLAAYALRGWQVSTNHLALAQGWLLVSLVTMRFAAAASLAESDWRVTFDLAFQAVRSASRALLMEASGRDDLIEPHLAEGAFYGTRALLVLGWCCAHVLSEKSLESAQDIAEPAKRLLKRELKYIRVLGESAAPFVFAIANVLSILESPVLGEEVVLGYLRGLLSRNQPDGDDPLPDPYHGIVDTLAYSLALEPDTIDPHERFDGHAYTSRLALEWLVRRLRRRAVSSLWADYSRVATCEFHPSGPLCWLTVGDSAGTLDIRHPKSPASWAELREESLTIDLSIFPDVLRRNTFLLPFLPLVFPPRFTSALSRAIDFFWFFTQDFIDVSRSTEH